MKGEIKFRAWVKSEVSDGWFMSYPRWISLENKSICTESGMQPKEFTLMQFTGIKDKNGKEIYDTDIAKIKKVRGITIDYGFFETTGQVFYHNGSYYVGGQDVLLSSMKPLDIEVIGNIYENPELLEVK